MINTAIVDSYLARSASIGVVEMVCRELSNSVIFRSFLLLLQIFPTPLNDILHSSLYHLHIFYFRLQLRVFVIT